MTGIIEHEQGLNLGRRYELYEFDLSVFGLGFIRIFEGDENANHAVNFGGVTYNPWPLETSGWKVSVNGTLPRPRFAVANTKNIFTPMITNNRGLSGAPVRRVVTYERYLDGQPDADATAHNPIEYYEINRVVREGLVDGVEAIQWELITPIDRPNAKIPRIQIIRGPCQFSYRQWNSTTGQFENGTCPFRGPETFDENNAATDNAGDECAQTPTACTKRYGVGNQIPYLAFVSVEEVRLR